MTIINYRFDNVHDNKKQRHIDTKTGKTTDKQSHTHVHTHTQTHTHSLLHYATLSFWLIIVSSTPCNLTKLGEYGAVTFEFEQHRIKIEHLTGLQIIL